MSKTRLDSVETAPAQEKTKKTAGNILNIVVNVILVLAILLAALCTYVSFVSSSGNGVPSILGIEMLSVQTDSMYPTLKPGDLVIAKRVTDASELRAGDIITYWTVINGERVLNTHRINEIYNGGDYLIFETKGDYNNAADLLTVHESEVVGKYVTHIGGVGKLLDYLQTSTGFLVVIVIPVAIFFLFHLIKFFKILFEYQNVKSRLKYQQELDALGAENGGSSNASPAPPVVDKAAIEAELREQLKAEMMAEMLKEMQKQNAAAETPVEEAPAEEVLAQEAPAQEKAVEEPPVEEAPEESHPEQPGAEDEKATAAEQGAQPAPVETAPADSQE